MPVQYIPAFHRKPISLETAESPINPCHQLPFYLNPCTLKYSSSEKKIDMRPLNPSSVTILYLSVFFLSLVISGSLLRAEEADDLVSRYVTMAIQGDISGASTLFSGNTNQVSKSSLEIARQFDERFVRGVHSPVQDHPDVLVRDLVAAYRGYWRSLLMNDSSRTEAEAVLRSALSQLLQRENAQDRAGKDVFDDIHLALDARGLHYVETTDPPMRDLLLWRTEQRRGYSVQLTDHLVRLDVFFMDDFDLQGWKDYASLGLAATTGWVENGALYCVAWAYDEGTENFSVSYLKHEARHLLDLERFPEMDSTELEYRAKLTELAFANRTLKRVLEDFTAKAEENDDSPHAMANWRVVRDIHWSLYGEELPAGFTGWGVVNVGKVNRAARSLLKANTQQHEAQLEQAAG